MGVVRSGSIKNLAPIVPLESVKLGTSNLVRRLTLVSTSASLIDYPRMGCAQSHVTF